MAKFYVIWNGRETGVFTSWNACKAQVHQYPGASFKAFPNREEAETAFKAGSTPRRSKRSRGHPAGAPSRSSADQPNKSAKVAERRGPQTLSAPQIAELPHRTKVFTDGACDPNPGACGSGLAVYRDSQLCELWYGLYNPDGTNNIAELNALNQALLLANEELTAGNTVAIFCDSKYSIQCISEWAAKWKKSGWKKKGGEIKNLAIIQPMFEMYQELGENVQLYHVEGHAGIEGNELADRMSMLAIESQDVEFCRFTEIDQIPAILAMRSG